MKQIRIISLLCILSIYFSCTRQKQYTIGVSQCVGGEWRNKVNNEMLAAQHLYEHDVKVILKNADDHTDLQVAQIDSLVEDKVDLLVVAPKEYGQLSASIAQARKKGIPVIFFDRKAETNDYTSYIGGDNVEAGSAMAMYATRLAQELKERKGVVRPAVVELTGNLTTSPDKERLEGFSSFMKTHPEISYRHVMTDWSYDGSYQMMKKLIQSGESVDIVFCHSDLAALGAYQGAKELDKEKQILFLGVDGMPGKDGGLESVQKGILAGTYIYPTHGEEIVRLALNILENKPYKRNNTLQSIVVTPENVNSIIDSQKVLQQQSNYLITIQQKLENSLGLYHIQRTMLILAVVIILLLVVALFLLWKGIHSIREANHKKTQAIKEQTLFYTNARHQLRTPLTLISGPLREIEQDGNLMGQDKKLLDVVLRNVRVLEDIVTGTLNFDTRKQKVVDDVAAVQARQEMQRDIQESNKDIILKTDSDELSTILIVDDNVDMRSYLRTILTSQYYVIEASDGQSGLQLARESVPNLIVSDVMMPVMSGLSFCRKIKEDALTSHIPVILLTARSTEQQQIEGFEHGADAYITKPFNAQFLLVRITNLLQSRMQLRKLFKEKMEESQESAHDIQVEMSTPDRRFLDALREAIYKRMNDTHLKMDDLGADMNISRVQLYRKVKALTGVSPAELLRQIRMQQAYKLLHTTDKTIQEIAYEIGFGTPGYFSSCFKKQYGKYPTELRK